MDLGVSPTVWPGFTLLITASVVASLIIFRCLLNGILNVLKTHGSVIQPANTLIGVQADRMCVLLYSLKINILLNHL